jgi:protease-4
MRTPPIGWLCLVLLAGCSKPMLVETYNRVQMEGPVATSTRLINDPSPVPDSGPVKPMVVEGSCGEHGHGRVALIDVDGILLNADLTGSYSMGENPVNLFRERLDAAARDKDVTAVVIRINSPGGAVDASALMHRELVGFKARTHKPVVACLTEQAAGGAYLLASAADAIVADPTTLTGGVGVIINLYNLKELMGQLNVFPQPVKAGPKIDLGTCARNLTEEEKKILQTIADEFHQYLQSEILKTRPKINLIDGITFDGRVFTASQAVERGLIDRVGFPDEALDLARQLGQCPHGAVVMYHRENDPARSIYAKTPITPLQGTSTLPSVPGIDRSRMPTFLSLWQPDMTLERIAGK